MSPPIVTEALNGTAQRPLQGVVFAVSTLILKGELILPRFYWNMPTILFMFICVSMLPLQSVLTVTEGVRPAEPETLSI